MERDGIKIDGRKLRTKFYREYNYYEPTWEFKEFFLEKCKQELNEHRYNAMRNLMYKVGRWERKNNKDVYDFSLEELKGMLKDFNSTSEMSLMSQKSNLEYYLLFAKSQSIGNLNVPSSIELNFTDIKEFINYIGSEQRFITRDDLYDLVEENLVNLIDQSMILLIFEGILGRANTELINLEWGNIDFKNCIIKSGDKVIQISAELADVLEKANNENTYLLANGNTVKDGKTVKRDQVEIIDKYESPYFLRPFKNKNKEEEQQMTGSAVQRRVLSSCKMYLDRPYLTLSSIYISGLVDRGIRHTYEQFGGELMRNVDWQNFLKETGERVNIQDSYKLYKEFWEKEQLAKQQEV